MLEPLVSDHSSDPGLLRYVVEKGSIAVDGISLTVVEALADQFSVMLIPHTREVTSLKRLKPGSLLNFEVDLVARYLVSYWEAGAHSPASHLA